MINWLRGRTEPDKSRVLGDKPPPGDKDNWERFRPQAADAADRLSKVGNFSLLEVADGSRIYMEVAYRTHADGDGRLSMATTADLIDEMATRRHPENEELRAPFVAYLTACVQEALEVTPAESGDDGSMTSESENRDGPQNEHEVEPEVEVEPEPQPQPQPQPQVEPEVEPEVEEPIPPVQAKEAAAVKPGESESASQDPEGQEEPVAASAERSHTSYWCPTKDMNILMGPDRKCPACGEAVPSA